MRAAQAPEEASNSAEKTFKAVQNMNLITIPFLEVIKGLNRTPERVQRTQNKSIYYQDLSTDLARLNGVKHNGWGQFWESGSAFFVPPESGSGSIRQWYGSGPFLIKVLSGLK